MSSRPKITALLSLSIQKHINPHNDPRIYWAKEVTFDYATSNAVRVDYMMFRAAAYPGNSESFKTGQLAFGGK